MLGFFRYDGSCVYLTGSVMRGLAATVAATLTSSSCFLQRGTSGLPLAPRACFVSPPVYGASASSLARPLRPSCLLAGARRIGASAGEGSEGEAGQPKILGKTTVGSTRWLQLVKLQWQDDKGRQREWDAAERPFPAQPGSPLMAPQASAVAILPVLRINGRLAEVILISQYRPPLGSMCLEAPAGLVGAGEDFKDTALRELLEETGLRAHAVLDDDASVLCNDPGITNAACRLLVVEVDADDTDNRKALDGIETGKVYGLQEEGESITLWRLPLPGLRDELNRLTSQGYSVDGKLHCFARGLALASVLS